ncbi:hypothetical protein T01_16039 [Trichinella spiralis]|uniref:Uncharacterized protein n=1 Tax=Trichinella spiralis TaxID=6334 RepID=A0A0V1BYW7_TRISP|nr:hypothetical protein T01_16039 [Trichinella spiralis]
MTSQRHALTRSSISSAAETDRANEIFLQKMKAKRTEATCWLVARGMFVVTSS